MADNTQAPKSYKDSLDSAHKYIEDYASIVSLSFEIAQGLEEGLLANKLFSNTASVLLSLMRNVAKVEKNLEEIRSLLSDHKA